MKRIGWELKKILADRALWVLLTACVIVQGCFLCGNLEQRDQLRWWNDLIGRTGSSVTAESLDTLREYSQTEHEALDAGKKPSWAAYIYLAYQQLDSLDALIEDAAQSLEQVQDFSPDMLLPTAEGESTHTRLEMERDNAIRARAAQANAAHEADYFSLGEVFSGREALFRTLFFFFYLEMILTAAYVAARSASLEFAEGTQQLVYTCRCGRKFQRDKLAAVLTAVAGIYLLCAAVMAAAYLLVYPQRHFLLVPYSAEPFASGLSRFPVSFLGYMLLHLALGFVIVIVLAALMFGLTAWGRSPMIGVSAFLAIGAALMTTGGIVQPELAALAHNPVSLLLAVNPRTREVTINTANWFCYTGRPIDLPHIEWISLLLWAAATALLCAVMIRRFRRREVV